MVEQVLVPPRVKGTIAEQRRLAAQRVAIRRVPRETRTQRILAARARQVQAKVSAERTTQISAEKKRVAEMTPEQYSQRYSAMPIWMQQAFSSPSQLETQKQTLATEQKQKLSSEIQMWRDRATQNRANAQIARSSAERERLLRLANEADINVDYLTRATRFTTGEYAYSSIVGWAYDKGEARLKRAELRRVEPTERVVIEPTPRQYVTVTPKQYRAAPLEEYRPRVTPVKETEFPVAAPLIKWVRGVPVLTEFGRAGVMIKYQEIWKKVEEYGEPFLKPIYAAVEAPYEEKLKPVWGKDVYTFKPKEEPFPMKKTIEYVPTPITEVRPEVAVIRRGIEEEILPRVIVERKLESEAMRIALEAEKRAIGRIETYAISTGMAERMITEEQKRAEREYSQIIEKELAIYGPAAKARAVKRKKLYEEEASKYYKWSAFASGLIATALVATPYIGKPIGVALVGRTIAQIPEIAEYKVKYPAAFWRTLKFGVAGAAVAGTAVGVGKGYLRSSKMRAAVSRAKPISTYKSLMTTTKIKQLTIPAGQKARLIATIEKGGVVRRISTRLQAASTKDIKLVPKIKGEFLESVTREGIILDRITMGVAKAPKGVPRDIFIHAAGRLGGEGMEYYARMAILKEVPRGLISPLKKFKPERYMEFKELIKVKKYKRLPKGKIYIEGVGEISMIKEAIAPRFVTRLMGKLSPEQIKQLLKVKGKPYARADIDYVGKVIKASLEKATKQEMMMARLTKVELGVGRSVMERILKAPKKFKPTKPWDLPAPKFKPMITPKMRRFKVTPTLPEPFRMKAYTEAFIKLRPAISDVAVMETARLSIPRIATMKGISSMVSTSTLAAIAVIPRLQVRTKQQQRLKEMQGMREKQMLQLKESLKTLQVPRLATRLAARQRAKLRTRLTLRQITQMGIPTITPVDIPPIITPIKIPKEIKKKKRKRREFIFTETLGYMPEMLAKIAIPEPKAIRITEPEAVKLTKKIMTGFEFKLPVKVVRKKSKKKKRKGGKKK